MGAPSIFALPKTQGAATVQPQTQLTIKQLKSYPVADRTLTLPEPTIEAKVQVAAGRDGPFAMHYMIYGGGPARILVCRVRMLACF